MNSQPANPIRHPRDEAEVRMSLMNARALLVFGNSTRAGVWLNCMNATFEHKRPWDLCGSDAELRRVLDELDRLSLEVVPDLHDPVAASIKDQTPV